MNVEALARKWTDGLVGPHGMCAPKDVEQAIAAAVREALDPYQAAIEAARTYLDCCDEGIPLGGQYVTPRDILTKIAHSRERLRRGLRHVPGRDGMPTVEPGHGGSHDDS